MLAGVCGSSYVIANAYIADVTAPDDRARAYGLMGAAFGVGFVLGPAIGGCWRVSAQGAVLRGGGGVGPQLHLWLVCPARDVAPPKSAARSNWRRANPFGALAVFRRYSGVLPLLTVLTVFFFASSVYPAIWAFWGIAKFGWSASMVGLTLAAFGIITALFQGLLAGPAVARFGEWRWR